MENLNIALIGTGFMGRAHSNGFGQVRKFFDLPLNPVLHTVYGRDPEKTAKFATRWGWENFSTDWRKVVAKPAIDLVIVATPNNTHAEIAIAALQAGKHVLCEKPLADTLSNAQAMYEVARRASGKAFAGFNYRRCPGGGRTGL